jgi:hypothetical protein
MNNTSLLGRTACAWAFFLIGYMASYLDLIPLLYRVVGSGAWTFTAPTDAPVMRLYGMLLNGIVWGAIGSLVARGLKHCSIRLQQRLAKAAGALALASTLLVFGCEIQHWMLTQS